ncbi:MAG: hypothetical protein ACOCXP_03390, partial [Candidatus Dojkabacteria bacterium]
MNFLDFTKYLSELERESGRLALTETIAQMLTELEEEEIGVALYLLKGQIGADYEDLEFYFSAKSMVNAIQSLAGKGEEGDMFSLVSYDASSRYAELGDSGLLVQDFIKVLQEHGVDSYNPKAITLEQIHKKLRKIVATSGKGSVEKKSQ